MIVWGGDDFGHELNDGGRYLSQGQDTDGDGTDDLCDNCVAISNTDRADRDLDGVGDACDNCPDESDANQFDSDFDAVGDACDGCPLHAAPGADVYDIHRGTLAGLPSGNYGNCLAEDLAVTTFEDPDPIVAVIR